MGSAGRAGTTSTTGAPAPLTILSTTPANGTTDVPSDQVVTVHLSAPAAGPAGLPAFDPPVSGTWTQVGPSTFTFAATAPFIPTTTESLVFPPVAPVPTGGAERSSPHR